METKTIHEKLVAIQSDLKAPKGQTNAFGKYKYRSCEDILESVKPLLKEHAVVLTISDEMVEVGGRVYVKATATVRDPQGSVVVTTAFAREANDKKGMDEAQVTGAAASYARKYALNGLFCIDDTKDADTMDNRKVEAPKAPAVQTPRASFGQLEEIELLLKETNSNKAEMHKFYNIAPDAIPSPDIAAKMIEVLKKKLSTQLDAA